MSATVPETPPQPHEAGTALAPEACPRCGAGLAPEQDWCLECGAAARTRVVGATHWRLPLGIVAAVVLLLGAAFAYAFVAVSDDAGRSAQKLARGSTAEDSTPAPASTAPTTSTPAGTGAAAAPGAATTPGSESKPGDPTPPPAPADASAPKEVGSWPAGKTAYTVILLSTQDRGGARAKARQLAAEGEDVGLLRSDDFPSLEPGYSVVFSGQYEDVGAAQQEAKRLAGAGAPGAYAKLVSPR